MPTNSFAFISGFGAATTIWSGMGILIELFRHRSMLESPYPDVGWYHFIPFAIGVFMWIAGAFLQ